MADEHATLVAEQRRIGERIARLRSHLTDEIGRGVVGSDESSDYGSDVYEREKALALIRNLSDTLSGIEHALHTQAAGHYGTCESCGEPIDPDRLEALPQTTVCLKCQTGRESRAKSRRSMDSED